MTERFKGRFFELNRKGAKDAKKRFEKSSLWGDLGGCEALDKLWEFLQEDNGGNSSCRLIMYMVALSAIIDWQHAVWTVGRWTPNYEIVVILLSTMGLKVLQKKFEK